MFGNYSFYAVLAPRFNSSLQNILQARQCKSGAFGMKRQIGSDMFPNYQLLEHARHTATAGLFFLKYDGADHENVRRACEWLLDNQESDGSWSDSAPPSDPVTVAFVINFLEQYAEAVSNSAAYMAANVRTI